MKFFIAGSDTNGKWDVMEEIFADSILDLRHQVIEWGHENGQRSIDDGWPGVWILDENMQEVDV